MNIGQAKPVYTKLSCYVAVEFSPNSDRQYNTLTIVRELFNKIEIRKLDSHRINNVEARPAKDTASFSFLTQFPKTLKT